jgi:hypothetical protein
MAKGVSVSDLQTQTNKFTFNLFLTNLFKLIPLELIALYVFVKSLIPITADPIPVFIILGAFVVLVPVYLVLAAGIKDVLQVIVNTVAMIVYIVALGIPGKGIPGVGIEPWMISAAMAVLLLVPPIIAGHRLDTKDIPVVSAFKRVVQ